MKVNLVVATGAHQGKIIPIIGSQFLIGRDPQCQLRPASQAVSKQHCAVIVRDGKIYLKDYGSTNGTVVNEAIVQGEERQLNDNDSVKIGPLDFKIRIEEGEPRVDGTPLPEMNPEATAALAAVKAATQSTLQTAVKNATPAPALSARPSGVKDGSQERPAVTSGSKESPSLPLAAPTTSGAGSNDDSESDRLAAMLLGLDDGEVPGGSTVVDVPVPTDVAATGDSKDAAKPTDKKAVPSREDTSNAASDILRKYMRRPR
jgi:predicted component of type VI protein secretion system